MNLLISWIRRGHTVYVKAKAIMQNYHTHAWPTNILPHAWPGPLILGMRPPRPPRNWQPYWLLALALALILRVAPGNCTEHALPSSPSRAFNVCRGLRYPYQGLKGYNYGNAKNK